MYRTIVRSMRQLARRADRTARANAAEGSAALRSRRHEQEAVEEYLRGRRDEHGRDDTL